MIESRQAILLYNNRLAFGKCTQLRGLAAFEQVLINRFFVKRITLHIQNGIAAIRFSVGAVFVSTKYIIFSALSIYFSLFFC